MPLRNEIPLLTAHAIFPSIVSGEAPSVPVVSVKSGNIFEKRLIEAYIAEHGKDPVTGEELTPSDLIAIKSMIYFFPLSWFPSDSVFCSHANRSPPATYAYLGSSPAFHPPG